MPLEYGQAMRELLMAIDPVWYGGLLAEDHEPGLELCEERIVRWNDVEIGWTGIGAGLRRAIKDLERRERCGTEQVLAEAEAALREEVLV
jgi:hypothetical protein